MLLVRLECAPQQFPKKRLLCSAIQTLETRSNQYHVVLGVWSYDIVFHNADSDIVRCSAAPASCGTTAFQWALSAISTIRSIINQQIDAGRIRR